MCYNNAKLLTEGSEKKSVHPVNYKQIIQRRFLRNSQLHWLYGKYYIACMYILCFI